jgi:hypothetical protein
MLDTLPKNNAEIVAAKPLNDFCLKYICYSFLTLSNDKITLKNKIVFAAILIFLVAAIAYFIQQHYFQSYRDSLTPVDFSILYAKQDHDLYELSFLCDKIIREAILCINRQL